MIADILIPQSEPLENSDIPEEILSKILSIFVNYSTWHSEKMRLLYLLEDVDKSAIKEELEEKDLLGWLHPLLESWLDMEGDLVAIRLAY